MEARFRVRTDVHGDEGAYVLHVDQKSNLLAACLSKGDPKLYHVSPDGGIRFEAALGHDGMRASRASFVDENVLSTSSDSDGTLRLWDTRNNQMVMLCRSKQGALWCHDAPVDTPTMAAGGDALLLLWDRRKAQSTLAEREDVHSDSITQVRFRPIRYDHIVSAGVDGLICVTQANADVSEDDAVEAVVSAGTSIADFGFYGKKKDRLWITTHIETVQTFKWDGDPQSYEPRANLENVREQASTAWQRACSQSSMSGLQLDINYVAGCSWDALHNQLHLHVGNTSGDIVEFPLDKKGTLGSPSMVLQGGHTQVVRTVLRDPTPGIACVTAGEDSNICIWMNSGVDRGLQNGCYAPERVSKAKHSKHSPY